MASPGVIRKMQTTNGKVFIIGRRDRTKFVPQQYAKYYKTFAGATRAIKKSY